MPSAIPVIGAGEVEERTQSLPQAGGGLEDFFVKRESNRRAPSLLCLSLTKSFLVIGRRRSAVHAQAFVFGSMWIEKGNAQTPSS